MRYLRLALPFWLAAMLLRSAHPVPVAAQTGPPVPHRVDPRPAVAAGKVELLAWVSASYGRERRTWIYTPPGYAATRKPGYDLLVAFDGEEYLDTIPLPLMLDTLLAAGRLPPFVALLVDNGDGATRIGDLANRAAFAKFLGDELLPLVRQRWNVTRDPRRTIVTGSSAGGLGAAYVAFQRPELFGNVLSQSGAFWRGNEGSNSPPFEWLTGQVAGSPRREIRFVLDVGEREIHRALGSGPVFIEANRRLRDALVARGYPVIFTEVPGAAHAPEFWRVRLPEDLVALTAGW